MRNETSTFNYTFKKKNTFFEGVIFSTGDFSWEGCGTLPLNQLLTFPGPMRNWLE